MHTSITKAIKMAGKVLDLTIIGNHQDYKEKHKLDSKQISNSPC